MANIKRNLVYNFFLSISQVLLPLVSIPYISRILDPDGIGRVSFIDSFTYYLVAIAEFGIMVYGIREVAKQKNDPVKLRALVSELLTLHIISSACTLILYATGVFLLWDKIGDTRLLLFSLSFFIVNFFSCDWYFMGVEKFGFITVRTLIIRSAGLACIFLLIKKPADYYVYYAIITASAIAVIVWNIIALLREVPFSFHKTNWKKHLKHVWVTYLISIFYSIPLMLDNVLLRLVSTASAVGLYAFSIKIVRTAVTLFTDSFLVFFPRIVALAGENDDQQLRQKVLLNIRFIILLSIPMGTGLYLLADEVAHLFFGEKFLSVAGNLRLLAAYPFLKGVSLFFSNPILIAHHKEKHFLRNLAGGAVLFIAMAIVLGFYYADTGICLALLVTELYLLIANYFSIKKTLPQLPVFDFATFGHALLGSAFFVPVVYLVKWMIAADWIRLVIGIPVCVILYGIWMIIVKNSFVRQAKSSFLVLLSGKPGPVITGEKNQL